MRSLLTLLPILIFGCQTAPSVKKVEAAVTTTPEALVSLERTACYGACPIYAVSVLSDGTTRFRGERHVKVTEPVEVKLEPAALAKLKAAFETSGFEKWPDYTRTNVSDMPSVVLTYKGHTVRHNRGDEKAPPELTALEDEVDAIIGTDRWVKGTGAETQ
ncbi:MAG: DUF6438 domain-containing protein [Archangium sp.]|nr:DUF6438 domain-containing protein [Archangium sp.]